MQSLRSERLANGLILQFFDRSNRYFGNFHRVAVEVRIRLVLTADHFAGADDPVGVGIEARLLLGEELIESRMLQHMGVAGEEVAAVRDQLISGFIGTAGPYLGRPDYPRRLLARRLAERGRPGWPRAF
jgi:hypothetical protein